MNLRRALEALARASEHDLRRLAFRDYLRSHPAVAAEYVAAMMRYETAE